MMFMRFPIDAVFVGRPDGDEGARPVLSVHEHLPAWRGLVPLVRGAHGVLELPVGTIAASGTTVGDRLLLALSRPRRSIAARKPRIRRDREDARVDVIARVPGRVLDLAFPAVCPGCRREGPPICDGCMPALDARLEQAAGVPIGLPSGVPAPLLQLEWCAPFGGVVRRALHELKYGGETRLARAAGRGRRAPLAVCRGRRRPARPGPGPRGAAASTRLRPGGADRRRGGSRAGVADGAPAPTRAIDDRPVRSRSSPAGHERRRSVRARAGGHRNVAERRGPWRRGAARRLVGRPRGRRRHDRSDARRVRRAAARRRGDRRLRRHGRAGALTRRHRPPVSSGARPGVAGWTAV